MYPSLHISEKTIKLIFNENNVLLQRVVRIILVGVALVIATIVGFVICIPLIIVIPLLFHLKITAKGGLEKFIDVVMSVIGFTLLGLSLILLFM